MNTKGKIIVINETEVISDNFKKRSFVLEHGDNPQYLENVLFEFHQDKCSLLDSFKIGDNVEVEFNLKGRKWTNQQGEDKYFNTLNAWKITKDNGTHDITPEHDENKSIAEPEWLTSQGSDGDELPF